MRSGGRLLLPLPALGGERGGVRGSFGKFDSWRVPLTRPRPSSRSTKRHPALADVEIGGVQLRLENAGQGDRVLGFEGEKRICVAVLMRCVQGRLNDRRDRATEL